VLWTSRVRDGLPPRYPAGPRPKRPEGPRWEFQIAQAKRNTGLLSLSERCHPQTLRQIRWANTMLKTQTPQVLSSLGS
jgi:hypothetical protein